MQTKYYKNKKNGKEYRVLTEGGINANNGQEFDSEVSVFYTDGKEWYRRDFTEFHEKFELSRIVPEVEG